jgi:hypothetical protein
MAASEQDPGVSGTKLSKSGDNGLVERNKSYEKVLDAQNAYLRIRGQGKFDGETEALSRWRAKSAWHEKTFGW